MIRIERAVHVLEAAGLLLAAQKDEAVAVLQDADPIPDLIARHIMADFWLMVAQSTAEDRQEYGGDVRQLGIAVSQTLTATKQLATAHDWLRALELTLLNIEEESVEYLTWFEQAGARRWATPREQAVAYFCEEILSMDGVRIPEHVDHPVRRKPTTDSGGCCPPVPGMSSGHSGRCRPPGRRHVCELSDAGEPVPQPVFSSSSTNTNRGGDGGPEEVVHAQASRSAPAQARAGAEQP
jgi:hypothetical protein